MSDANKVQIDLWNGRVGERWAKMKLSLDAWVAPVTAVLRARAGEIAGRRLLDIGCGTGETCALWLDAGAVVTGVDVSEPMLAVAAERTGGKATLIRADASVWRGDAPFDLAVSQFGVMFFADPDAAFASIAANLRPGGRFLFSCWRPVGENEWVYRPMEAVADLIPPGPVPPPDAPGPFALADKARLLGILARAGFADVSIEPFDFPVCFASEGGVDAAVRFAMQIGPTASALAEVPKETKIVASERLKVTLAPHERDGVVTLGGAVWMVQAVRAA